MDRPKRLIPERLRALRDSTREMRETNDVKNRGAGVAGPQEAAPDRTEGADAAAEAAHPKRSRARRAAAILVAGACLVGIVASVVVLAGGGTEEAPQETAAERHMRACALNHGLSQAVEKRPTRPGESPILRPAAARFAAFPQETHLSCDWPPPPGAFADGYGVIVVTAVAGPGQAEASGANYADRIESRCRLLLLRYRLSSMGQSTPLEPFEAPLGTVVRWGGARWRGGGEGETRTLPFRPSGSELVVVHNGMSKLERARCAR